MLLLVRFIKDLRGLWRIWAPLLLVATLAPLFAVATPLVEKQLIDGVVLTRRLNLLGGIALLYAALWLLSTLNWVVGSVLRAYMSERTTLSLRQRLFAHSGHLSLAFVRQEHSGRTLSLFVNDVPILSDLFSTTVAGSVGSFVALILSIVVMATLNWQLALAGIFGPAVVSACSALVTRPLRGAARRAQEKAAEVVTSIQEHLTGMREIVAFGQVQKQEAQFSSTLWQLLRLRMRVALLDTGIQSGASLVSLVVTVTILIYGAYLVIEGKTTLGTVVAMRSLLALLFQPAGQLMGLFSSAQKALGAADRVYAFLDEKPAVEDSSDGWCSTDIAGDLEFVDVHFEYQPGHPVLSDVSMSARTGEMIALVGPSGGGKSTLMSLVARFYDPKEGSILIDGIDLRTLPISALRDQIGYVFQDTFLFDTTIRDNIALGDENATDKKVEAAARAAHAWEFIEHMPRGLDTKVGERGVHLSEGQKQRIAIARAILREPRILILDEPTSALDARSEHLLQAGLDNLMRGRTTFVIAHRLATVRKADRLVVLDAGRIIEQGTHSDLIRRGGAYRELFDLQFGEGTWGSVSDPNTLPYDAHVSSRAPTHVSSSGKEDRDDVASLVSAPL